MKDQHVPVNNGTCNKGLAHMQVRQMHTAQLSCVTIQKEEQLLHFSFGLNISVQQCVYGDINNTVYMPGQLTAWPKENVVSADINTVVYNIHNLL